jgi:molybdopterin converting factor small subunit
VAVLHVPASLRALSGDRDRFEVGGATLRAVFRAVAEQCPELVSRIIEDDTLRPDIAVALDGNILDDGNLAQQLSPDADIYLVPPIGGGSRPFPRAALKRPRSRVIEGV